MFRTFRNKLALMLSSALLLGMTLEAMSLRRPEDAEPYHAKVRQAAENLPSRIGDWIVQQTDKADIPKEAVTLLRPNVIFYRKYRNVASGREVTFLLVQCGDARDLVGHYPPVCYVNQGWTLRQKVTQDWTLDDGMKLYGMEYEFDRMAFKPAEGLGAYPTTIRVANFMILPDGNQIVRDMDAVRQAASD